MTMITEQQIEDEMAYFETQRALAAGIHGEGHWCYLRIWPDGTITHGAEVSPCYPESEYYRRAPHPVTIITSRETYAPDPDTVCWERCSRADADFVITDDGMSYWYEPEVDAHRILEEYRRTGRKYRWARFTGELPEPIEVDDVELAEAIRKCRDAGIEVSP